MKTFGKVLDRRLRKPVNFSDVQFDFMPEKTCTDSKLILRTLQENGERK